jgi:hypothetical protein
MPASQISNVYQFKKPQQKPDLALDNFQKWVALKNQAIEATNSHFSYSNQNKFNLKPNFAQPKFSPHPKMHFFSPYSIKPNNPQLQLNDTLKKMREEQEKLTKQHIFSLGCNICGELDHNSGSCVKPKAR